MSERKTDYIFELPMQVRDYEVDVQGIVTNANYLHYLETTRHAFCDNAGFPFRKMHEEGMDPVVCHIDIHYRHALGLSEKFVSKLALRRKGCKFVFIQDIYTTDGTTVVNAEVEVVLIQNGRLSNGNALADVFKNYL